MIIGYIWGISRRDALEVHDRHQEGAVGQDNCTTSRAVLRTLISPDRQSRRHRNERVHQVELGTSRFPRHHGPLSPHFAAPGGFAVLPGTDDIKPKRRGNRKPSLIRISRTPSRDRISIAAHIHQQLSECIAGSSISW